MSQVSQRASEYRVNGGVVASKASGRRHHGLRVWTNGNLAGPDPQAENLLRRLEAENAQLRDKAIVLALQIQALQDRNRA